MVDELKPLRILCKPRLGSPVTKTHPIEIERANHGDLAFQHFHSKLSKFLKRSSPAAVADHTLDGLVWLRYPELLL